MKHFTHPCSSPMLPIILSRSDWESIAAALEYAADDRYYQAQQTEDPEDRAAIEACAQDWENLANCISGHLK